MSIISFLCDTSYYGVSILAAGGVNMSWDQTPFTPPTPRPLLTHSPPTTSTREFVFGNKPSATRKEEVPSRPLLHAGVCNMWVFDARVEGKEKFCYITAWPSWWWVWVGGTQVYTSIKQEADSGTHKGLRREVVSMLLEILCVQLLCFVLVVLNTCMVTTYNHTVTTTTTTTTSSSSPPHITIGAPLFHAIIPIHSFPTFPFIHPTLSLPSLPPL